MADRMLRRTCTVCPRGCSLEITVTGSGIEVTGNQCPRGEDYGYNEATAPLRVLTTTVTTTEPRRPRLPVRSFDPVPLAEIPRLMRAIDDISLRPPVRCGDLVAANLCGLGVTLIATDDLDSSAEGE